MRSPLTYRFFFSLNAFLAACILLSSAASCVPEIDILDSSFRSEHAELTGNNQNIQILFDSKAGTASVELKANLAWQAEFLNGRATWCSLSTESGKRGTAKLTISVTENTTYEERSATIAFNCKDAKVIILVIQKQNDAILLSSSTIEAPASGGVFKIDVRHNIDYSLSLAEETESWITIVGTKALTTSSVSLKVAANEEISKREGQIIVKSNLGKEVINVYQDGATPMIVLSQNSYTISDDGGVISVDVKSNVNYQYEIREGAEWITEVETKSMSTHTLVFGIKANESYDDRSGSILFTDKETGIEEEVTVFQRQKNALLLTQKEYTLSDEGQIITVEVKSNVEFKYNITEGGEWISELKTKGLNTHILQFEVKPNEEFDDRTGKILFTDEEEGLAEEVWIVQKQKDALLLTQSEYSVSCQGETIIIEIISNTDFSYKIEDGINWVYEINTKSLTNNILHFFIQQNEDVGSRTATITFITQGLSEIVTINQEGETPSIIVNKDIRELYGEGDLIDIELKSNVSVECKIPYNCDWLHEVTTKTMSNSIIQLMADRNSSQDPRSARVFFTDKETGTTDSLLVTQGGYFIYVLTISTISSEMNTPVFVNDAIRGESNWGDGHRETYDSTTVHKYVSDNEKTATFTVYGKTDAVTIPSMKGVKHINLTQFCK